MWCFLDTSQRKYRSIFVSLSLNIKNRTIFVSTCHQMESTLNRFATQFIRDKKETSINSANRTKPMIEMIDSRMKFCETTRKIYNFHGRTRLIVMIPIIWFNKIYFTFGYFLDTSNTFNYRVNLLLVKKKGKKWGKSASASCIVYAIRTTTLRGRQHLMHGIRSPVCNAKVRSFICQSAKLYHLRVSIIRVVFSFFALLSHR